MRSHPVGFFADKKSNRGHAGWNHPPLSRRGVVERGRVGREASPTHGSGKAELVEPPRIVIGDAPAENLSLPRIRRNFESLQLAQYIEDRTLSLDLASGRHMLPTQQPAHELRRGYRLDLLAQRGNRQPVNAGQQAPFAPLVFGFEARLMPGNGP